LSLLGLLHCFWGAQFIGTWLDFTSFIFNHTVQSITAKLVLSDWLQLQLTIQGAPPRLDDANWASNLKIWLLLHRFRIFTHLSGFLSRFQVYFLLLRRREAVRPICAWSSWASVRTCAPVLLRWVQMRRVSYVRGPYVGFNKKQGRLRFLLFSLAKLSHWISPFQLDFHRDFYRISYSPLFACQR